MSAPTASRARLLTDAQVDEVNEERLALGLMPLPTGFADRPVIAFSVPASEPKPHVRQNIPGTTNYFLAGLMFNEHDVPIHAVCFETAEFCDCTPRYSPPSVAHLRDAMSVGAK